MPALVGKRGLIFFRTPEDLCTSRSPEAPDILSPGPLTTSQLNPSQLIPKPFTGEGGSSSKVTQDVSGQYKHLKPKCLPWGSVTQAQSSAELTLGSST